MMAPKPYIKTKRTISYKILSGVFLSAAMIPFFSTLLAQTGPGGVGNSANNVLWVSGDNAVYSNAGTTLAANGGDVQQWNDRSGNGNNLTQTITALKPTYNTTNAQNTIPVIRFTANNDDYMLATITATANQATVYAVVRYSSLPSTNPGILQGSSTVPGGSPGYDFGTNKNIGMWVEASSGRIWGRGIQSNGTAVNIPIVAAGATSANTFYSICSIYGGSAIAQYLDGIATSSVTYNNTLSSWRNFGVGRQGTETWNGDIAEVIAYNTNINAAQKIIADNYLAAKYGLSLGANDVYTMDNSGNGNFDFDVAGIGQTTTGVNQLDSKGSGILEIVGVTTGTNVGNGEFFMWGHDGGIMGQSTFDLPSGIVVRLQRIWRASEYGGDVGTLNLTFDLTSVLSSIANGNPGANALRLIIDTNNDGSFADETTATGGVISGASRPTGGSPLFTFSGVNIANGQRFTIGSVNSSNAALPIELKQFDATVNDSYVELLWVTASERNCDYFNVEKSIDGIKFDELYKVKAAGNSLAPSNYSYVDQNPYKGISYYRLKQIEIGGSYVYSKVISANFNSRVSTNLISPNPVSEYLYVFFPADDDKKNKTLSIQNICGEILSEFSTSDASAMIDFRDFAPGIYILKILVGDEITVKRVVKE